MSKLRYRKDKKITPNHLVRRELLLHLNVEHVIQGLYYLLGYIIVSHTTEEVISAYILQRLTRNPWEFKLPV